MAKVIITLDYFPEDGEWGIEKIDLSDTNEVLDDDPTGEKYMRVNDAVEQVAYVLSEWNNS